MAFNDRPDAKTRETSPGTAYSEYGIRLTIKDCEKGLVVGRFCHVDVSEFDQIGKALNLKGSKNPNIGGVVLRNIANYIEDENKIEKASRCDIQNTGLVSVEAVDGEEPKFYEDIYAVNKEGIDAGKATIKNAEGTVNTNAKFIRKINNTTWLVLIK